MSWTPDRQINPPDFYEEDCKSCGTSTTNGSLCECCEEEAKADEDADDDE